MSLLLLLRQSIALGSDAATLAEAQSLALTASESVTLGEAQSLALAKTDTGTFLDGSPAVATAVQDSASAGEQVALALSSADSASASESSTSAAATAVTEPVTLGETSAVTLRGTDAGTLLDTPTGTAAPAVAESALASETGAITASLALDDSLTLGEGPLVITLASGDPVTLGDSGRVGFVVADSASLLETSGVLAAATTTDSGLLLETNSTVASTTVADTGTVGEPAPLVGLVTAESGGLTEPAPLVTLRGADSALLGEVSPALALTPADTFGLAESTGGTTPTVVAEPSQLGEQAVWGPPAYVALVKRTPGVVGYWRLDEPSGTTCTDAVGSHPGTYTSVTLGAAGLLVGDPDTAASFNGTSSKAIIPNASSLITGGSLTLEGLVKAPASTQASDAGLFGIRTDTANGDFYLNLLANTSTLEARYTNSAGTSVTLNPALPLDGQLHHLALVYDAAAGTLTCLLDGLLPTGGSAAASGSITSTTQDLQIGLASSTQNNRFWNGVLDEVALYNVALAPATVRQHSNTARGVLTIDLPDSFTVLDQGQVVTAGTDSATVTDSARPTVLVTEPVTLNEALTLPATVSASDSALWGEQVALTLTVADQASVTERASQVRESFGLAESPAITAGTVTADTFAFGESVDATGPYVATVQAETGLVAYYRCAERSGSQLVDRLGAHHGVITGGVTYRVGGPLSSDPDPALGFDGSTGQATVASLSALITGGPLTLEGWAWLPNAPVTASAVFGFRNDTTADYCLFQPAGTNTITARFRPSTGVATDLTATVTPDTWHQLALGYDGTSTLSLVVDGLLVASQPASGTLLDPTVALRLGNDQDADALLGRVGQVALYNVAVPVGRLANHYATGTNQPFTSEPGTLGEQLGFQSVTGASESGTLGESTAILQASSTSDVLALDDTTSTVASTLDGSDSAGMLDILASSASGTTLDALLLAELTGIVAPTVSSEPSFLGETPGVTALLTSAEAASVTELLGHLASPFVTDLGLFAETLGVLVPNLPSSNDLANASEATALALGSADSGALGDSMLVSAGVAATELALLGDACALGQASSVLDPGTLTEDDPSLTAQVTGLESGGLGESFTALVTTGASETSGLGEAALIARAAGVTDTLGLLDGIAQLTALLTASDAASVLETQGGQGLASVLDGASQTDVVGLTSVVIASDPGRLTDLGVGSVTHGVLDGAQTSETLGFGIAASENVSLGEALGSLVLAANETLGTVDLLAVLTTFPVSDALVYSERAITHQLGDTTRVVSQTLLLTAASSQAIPFRITLDAGVALDAEVTFVAGVR